MSPSYSRHTSHKITVNSPTKTRPGAFWYTVGGRRRRPYLKRYQYLGFCCFGALDEICRDDKPDSTWVQGAFNQKKKKRGGGMQLGISRRWGAWLPAAEFTLRNGNGKVTNTTKLEALYSLVGGRLESSRNQRWRGTGRSRSASAPAARRPPSLSASLSSSPPPRTSAPRHGWHTQNAARETGWSAIR